MDVATIALAKKTVDERIIQIESYSTTETLTGGTWYDGKPIYRKVFTGLNFNVGVNYANTGVTLTGIETLVSGKALRGDNTIANSCDFKMDGTALQACCPYGFSNLSRVVVEYTKTTD